LIIFQNDDNVVAVATRDATLRHKLQVGRQQSRSGSNRSTIPTMKLSSALRTSAQHSTTD